MVHLVFIKTFVDIARTGSFRMAAEKNFMTQPAVSQQVRQLEEKLGAQLLERQNKKAYLTPAGKIFLTHAETILKQYEEAGARIHEASNPAQVQGPIRLATIYSIGLYELQPIVRKFLRQYPKVELHLEYQPFDKIYELVSNRAIDFGLVAYPERRYGIVTETFAEDQLVLVQSPHHPVLKKKAPSLSDLNGVKFVAFSAGTPTRIAIDNYLRSRGVFPAVVSEYDNIETLKSSVDLGIGCSILPRKTIQKEIKEGTIEVIPSVKINLTRPLGILYPKGKVFTSGMQIFYEMMLNRGS